YKVKIKGLPATDFPIIPAKKNTKSIELPAQAFRMALSRLLPCVAMQETRLELTGVNFLFSEKELALAATDSFRLAEEILPLEKFLEEDLLAEVSASGSLILPAATLMEVSRAISPTQKTISMTLDENQVFFEMEGIEVISRLILGKFPDYRQIMPQEFSFSAVIEKEAFLRSLKIATVFAAGEIAVELASDDGKVLVEAVSSGVGEQQAEVSAKFLSGSGRLRVVFPPKSLLDGVGFMETPSVAFRGNTTGTPVALTMTDEDVPRASFTYIMMPIQK
ncbi:MAG: DNA polymerase III subunit beta, partial [Candidatus Moraniibacteriota bacterium]